MIGKAVVWTRVAFEEKRRGFGESALVNLAEDLGKHGITVKVRQGYTYEYANFKSLKTEEYRNGSFGCVV